MTEQLPPDVIAQLTAMDSQITPELVADSWALLKPFHEKAGFTAPSVERDLRYGPHERHRLDVHTGGAQAGGAQAGGRGAPVFLFVHGGGFTGGDKVVPGGPQYDHIGAWAVRNGWVGVTITYRLAPGHQWPSGAQDVAAAVQWVRDNIASRGGDPDRIVVAGNSAGCVHVASYLAGQHSLGQHRPDQHSPGRDRPDQQSPGQQSPDQQSPDQQSPDQHSLAQDAFGGVRGAALISGFYQVPEVAERREPEVSYFGDQPSAAVATLPALLETQVPLIFAVAERDPWSSHFQVAALTAAWFARKGALPPVIWSEGHNHISQIGSIGVDDLALGAPLARFVNRVTQE